MKSQKIKYYLLILIFGLLGCQDDTIPKPYANVRLEYPEPTYQPFQTECPYTFEFSEQAIKQPKDALCAYNIYYPTLRATIYLTYETIEDIEINDLIRDAEKAVYEPHTTKAEYIEPKLILRPDQNVYGTLYELGGESAMNYQFHVTDSLNHFLRGAVYFRTHPKPDSLAPAVAYIGNDVKHIMETIKWK